MADEKPTEETQALEVSEKEQTTAPEEAGKETPKDTLKEAPAEVSKESLKAVGKEAPAETKKDSKDSGKEASGEAQKEQPKGNPMEKRNEPRSIVRLFRKDLSGNVNIERAIRDLRGVGFMMARAIRIRSGLPSNKKLSEFSDSELKQLETFLENLQDSNLPNWMLNRRKDYATGADVHLFEADLMLAHREDLTRLKKVKAYRGVRHMFGLKVRGQRTRSTGRKNRSVGVRKKKGPQNAPVKTGGK